jgi:hypothetical protein
MVFDGQCAVRKSAYDEMRLMMSEGFPLGPEEEILGFIFLSQRRQL